MKDYFFAVDLGATSGRTLIASISSDGFSCEEINRFPNYLIRIGGHFYWDIYELYRHILEGLQLVAERRDVNLVSIGIDTWGVDFVMLGEDGCILKQPFSYRDPHTTDAPSTYFKRMSRQQVYDKTGIQVMNFNTLFQLDTMRRNSDSALAAAKKILFLPDALCYMLSGEMVTEYTIASTSQLINAQTRRFDVELLHSVGLDESNFGRLVYPGERIGTLSKEVQTLTGLGAVPILSVAGHDTASAVAAVPALHKDFAYLSSGTWSLMGIEVAEPIINSEAEKLNFTNEGGVDHTIRFLKNICGMWLLERCRLEWCDVPYSQLIEEASSSQSFKCFINPDDACFANPLSMVQSIKDFCVKHHQSIPETRGEIVRCIFESLALRYREVLESLLTLSPIKVNVLHVIGGGSRNELLNQFIANALSMPVIAGPSEATGLGNIMVQSISCGVVKTVAEMRKLIHDQLPLKEFEPQQIQAWSEAFSYYQKYTK